MSFPRDRIKGKRGQELSAGAGSLQLGVQWRREGAGSAEVRRLLGDGGDVGTGSLCPHHGEGGRASGPQRG